MLQVLDSSVIMDFLPAWNRQEEIYRIPVTVIVETISAASTAVSGCMVCQSRAYFCAYSLSQNSGHF